MGKSRNIVGPKVRSVRERLRLTQPMLAARCRQLGWDLSRETLAKIEAQYRWVSDFELTCLATVLGIEVSDLLPAKDTTPRVLRKCFLDLGKGGD